MAGAPLLSIEDLVVEFRQGSGTVVIRTCVPLETVTASMVNTSARRTASSGVARVVTKGTPQLGNRTILARYDEPGPRMVSEEWMRTW